MWHKKRKYEKLYKLKAIVYLKGYSKKYFGYFYIVSKLYVEVVAWLELMDLLCCFTQKRS